MKKVLYFEMSTGNK